MWGVMMPKYTYQIVKCPFCNEERKSTGLHMHIKTHGKDIWDQYLKMKDPPRAILLECGKYKCSECDFTKDTIQSVTSHWWRSHTEKGKNHRAGDRVGFKKGMLSWNKGLTKHTDDRVKKNGETISKTLQFQIKNGTYVPRKMGIGARQQLSESQSLHNRGGRSKWYDVCGQKVQGTYELLFANTLNENNIKWEKIKTNNHLFTYHMKGKKRSYSPDFFLQDFDLYVEIKGVWWGDDKEKMEHVRDQHSDKNLIVIFGIDKLHEICYNIKEKLETEERWKW